MLFYTVGQSQIFITMVCAGLFIGALYDAMRLVRLFLSAGRLLTLGVDLVFGVGSAAFLIAFLLKANYAELRLYALLGAACGTILYQFTLGPLLRAVARGVGRFLRNVGRHIFETKFIKILLK